MRQIFREVRGEAEDIRFAPEINEACEGDMARLCNGIKPGRGRVHKCLKVRVSYTYRESVQPTPPHHENAVVLVQERRLYRCGVV